MSRPRLRAYWAALMIAAASVSADAQTPATETVKAELRAFVAELNAALQARDRAALERLYAPEFLFIHALGGPVNRAGQIAEALAAPPVARLPTPSFDGLMVIGDVALYRQALDSRFSTAIYSKASGRWQLLQMQGTPIPSSRPAATVPAEVLRGYAGRYQQDNGNMVTIAVDGDRLTFQVDGRQTLQLLALAPDRYSLPGGAGEMTFTSAADGRTTYLIQRPNQIVIKGTKQP